MIRKRLPIRLTGAVFALALTAIVPAHTSTGMVSIRVRIEDGPVCALKLPYRSDAGVALKAAQKKHCILSHQFAGTPPHRYARCIDWICDFRVGFDSSLWNFYENGPISEGHYFSEFHANPGDRLVFRYGIYA